ncbi:M55 family metallopeptidase [Romboutsia sp. 1001713B170207_170306_H8]|uniref:M55 family metallopeptidase n=1 Tax=Romboutsia sp. 1001713B170207_170306_H8 TaxID=2787112 RepID=UPI00189911E4|nr:M55 family metallopeptidase [Romboutsia sp. 1001713B170207_170306_H8]
MKIYISADIEGTCGIVDWNETELEHNLSTYSKQQMTQEVNAAYLGINEIEKSDILIKDAHDSGRNINPMKLPENIKILRGWTKDPHVMMAGIDKSFDASLFIGYHSPATFNGNPLSHTLDTQFEYIKINDSIASEFTINSYTSLYYNVPVAFLSGDEMLCRHAKQLTPNIITVPVSKGIGNSSISIHPYLALKNIKLGVKEALSGDLSRHLIKLPKHFKVEIKYKEHYKAFKASFYPNVKSVDSQTILFESNDYYEVLRMLLFI